MHASRDWTSLRTAAAAALALLGAVVAVTGAAAAAAPVKLQVAMWINDTPEIADTQAILDEYERMNPGVELELMQQPWTGYHEKMITLTASGLAPDVMVLSRTYVPSFADKGLIAPVDQWLAKEKFDVRRDVAELASGTYKGRIYGIPIWGGPAIMAFNADLFSAAGEPLPSQLERTNAWTWDRLIQAGKKLTRDVDGNGAIDQFMLPGPGTWEPDWATKVWTHGGRVTNDAQTEALIDRPEAVKGLELWANLSRSYHIAPVPGERAGNFEAGTQALTQLWSSEAPNLAKRVKNAFRVDLVTMPAGPAGVFHVAGGCPVAISTSTPHPQEAYKFATWFAMQSREWQLRGIPASVPIIRRDYRAFLAQFFANPDAVAKAVTSPSRMEPGIGLQRTELQAAWNPILTKIAGGQMSARAGATEMARQTNAILKQ